MSAPIVEPPSQTDPLRRRILDEIRRIAAANGKAPGRRTFELEAGIRESEWRGVFWARWGDALREAGLSANVRQGRIDEDLILDLIAQAFRHYGKVPTTIELRMYRNINPNFPAHSTLDNHFRSKSDLLERLRNWVNLREDYNDIQALLPIAHKNNGSKEPLRKSDGSVYLIKVGEFYKIGRSFQLERRIKEIRIAMPEAATLAHNITTDDPSGIEAYWHRRFANKRVNGEWFKLSVHDIAAFKRRKFQ